MAGTERMSFDEALRRDKQLRGSGAGRYRVAPKEQRTAEGIVFDSKREMQRYLELKALQNTGKIRDLTLQPEFVLQPEVEHDQHGKIRPIRYRADFEYRDVRTGERVVEDVKGYRTEVYQIKRKLLLRQFPNLTFREVK